MLFHFFTSLIDQYSFFNVFKYLTFRTGLSVISSLIVVFQAQSWPSLIKAYLSISFPNISIIPVRLSNPNSNKFLGSSIKSPFWTTSNYVGCYTAFPDISQNWWVWQFLKKLFGTRSLSTRAIRHRRRKNPVEPSPGRSPANPREAALEADLISASRSLLGRLC